ncbi:MAG TPA: GNAT family N-acetyltransferase [Flavisolibacter sp.]|nr:GNAT family N-acetyltransferase [Flavisolibacter sp.]
MNKVSNITAAGISDIQQLVHLINSAYRGEEAKKGWTHEADLIAGSVRTDEASLVQIIENTNAVILKYTDNNDNISGCVYLEKQGSQLYLGMFSVSPRVQGGGIGKLLLHAAEAHAATVGCTSIIMNVIGARHELISWYKRYGYEDTGVKKPFPDDDRFGRPTRPLEFTVLEKTL